MTHTILLTGASGALGRQLTRGLGEAGYTLRLTDIAPFPDALPPGATFTAADLVDGPAIAALAAGCRTILHFGGISTDNPFDVVLGPNITGLHNVYEAARAAKARVVFASSNHAIGFHERTEPLDADCALRPDSFYGLSKAYGELMGGLYWDKHGVESVNIRIGSCFPEPAEARMLSTWFSYADLVRLAVRCIETPWTGKCVIWGASANSRSFWRNDARAALGWTPQDSADGSVERVQGIVTDNMAQERYQGGVYCATGYSKV
jgi:uronate dehydrogenase